MTTKILRKAKKRTNDDWTNEKIKRVRSSRSDVFCKISVLEDFAKLTRKHLCQSVFFNKVAVLIEDLQWLHLKNF